MIGTNTLRSGGGLAVDGGIRYGIFYAIDLFENIENANVITVGISTLEAMDIRHRVKFRDYESGYPFKYDIVRYLYHKQGKLLRMK